MRVNCRCVRWDEVPGRREQAALLLANLASVETALGGGAIVVTEDRRVRVHALPITEPGADPRTWSLSSG